MAVHTATVLFSDLVGSTALLSRAGGDRSERHRREHFAAAEDAVAAHEGKIVKTLGDGVMAVFDSAAAAISAAQLLRVQTARLKRTGADALDVRIGIASGDVNVEDGDYFGAPVVQASRLCSIADPNQILVTDVVHVIAGDREGFDFGPVSEYTLKGFDVPVGACEVLATSDAPDDDSRVPFVGRDRELATLRSVFSVAMGGQIALALVSGEPGIGKTALVDRFSDEARELGATVHYGRGWEEGDAPPLWMWSQLLRSCSALVSPMDLGDQLGDGVADVVRSLADPRGAVESECDVFRRGDAQLRQFDAITEYLAIASRFAGIVLVLDDLHWADPATLALLRFASQDRRPSRILIMATYRDTEPDRPHVRDTVAALARAPHMVQLSLEGLDLDEAARIVHAQLGHSAPDDSVAALHRGTNGNPFFITQIVQLQREQGSDVPAAGTLPVPQTLGEVITRRLAMLPPGCVDVLEVAAVIGRDVSMEQLAALERFDSVSLVPLLDALERFRILTPAGGVASWRFTHDVLRSTVLSGIGAARLAGLHLEVAEAFVALGADGAPVDVEALALHFARSGTAGGRSEGAAYARKAAQHAQALFAHEDAARQYALALELSGDLVATDDLLALRLAEANERFLAGDHEGGRSAALEAARLARRSEQPSALASVAFVLSRAGSRWVTDPAAIALVEEAIAALPPGDTPAKVSLEARLAMEYFFSDPERARALSEDAVRRARMHGDDDALLDALVAQRFAIWTADGVEDLLEIGAEIIQLAPRVGRPEMASEGHHARRAAFHELGDFAGMEREMLALEVLAQEQRLPVDHAVVAAFRAMKAAMEGRYADAGDALERAIRIADRANDTQLSVGLVPLQTWLAREQRRFDEALGLVAAARAFQPASLMVEAATLATSCFAGEAVPPDRLHRLVGRLAEPRRDWLWLAAVAEASVCAHRAGDTSSAVTLGAHLEAYAASGRNVTCGPTLSFGAASYYAGICALTSGDLDRACASLDASVAANERMGARPWLLRSLTAVATALGMRGIGDDRKRRRERIEQASALAAQLEPSLAVDEFRALEGDGGNRHVQPSGLTDREAQMLRLAAEGLTNDAVARTLNVSVKTVERHLGNVYTKLGVRNRAEATAWAVRQGLA